MSTRYILTANLHNRPTWWDGPIAGTLEELTKMLIRIDSEIHEPGHLNADHWEELYWADPDAYDLDEDEETPERPTYTEDSVRELAATVYDEPVSHITLTVA